jgi:hypothetical protein
MRIIITARDAGSAYQNLAFAEDCVRLNRQFEYKFYVEGAAADILTQSRSGILFERLEKHADTPLGRKFLETEITGFRPDFALVGLAGAGRGVDEITRVICKRHAIPTGAIQDYWGYVGQFTGSMVLDYLFVVHDQAKNLTVKNAGRPVECVVVGSPKHERYQIHLHRWRDSAMLHKNGSFQIAFLGQPSELPGILENFKLFTEVLGQLGPRAKLLFKAHPADRHNTDLYREILEGENIVFEILNPETETEPLLLSSDLVVTCFSTSGVDHSYLQLYSDERIGELIYLTIGDAMQRTIKDAIGDDCIPYTKIGLGHLCLTKPQLELIIKRCLCGEPSKYRSAVRAHLEHPAGASERIYRFALDLCNQKMKGNKS